MQKFVWMVALSMIASSISANVVEIKNRSDFKLKGWVSLLGKSCPAESLKKVSLEIAAHSTKKVPSRDCCVYAMELRGPIKSSQGTWGGGDLAIIPAVATLGASAIRICGKSEKFEATVTSDHRVVITNVTGK